MSLEDSNSDSESSLEVSENDANTSYGSENEADPDYKAYVRQLIAEGDACEFQILNDNGEFEQETEHQLEIERNLQKVSRIRTTLAAGENENLEKVNKGIVSRSVKKDSRKSLRRNIQMKDNVIEAEDSRNAEKGPKSTARDIKEGDGEDENYNFYLKYLYEGSKSCFEDDADSESCFEDDADPQYKEYLKNLRAKENSYEFEIPTCNAEVEPEIKSHPNIERNSQKSSRIKKKCDKNLEKVNKETVKTGVKDDLRKSSRRNAQTKINIEELEDLRNDEKCPKRKVETKNKMLEPKKLRGKHLNSAKRSKRDAEVDDNIVTDTCYQEFLDNKHIEGDCMVYIFDNYKRLKYEEEDDVDGSESSSDIEIIKKEPIVQSGKTPQLYVSPVEGDDLQWIPNLVKDSKFRENLIEKLKKPYDQEEYDYLWNKLNEEKPRTFEKNTRFGVRKVVKDGLGKSYLERHNDLKAEISSVQYERPKKLNILRGFFYWLENSSHDGAFIPWKDPSCLTVIPGST